MSFKPIPPLFRDPRTKREWQNAANVAEELLLIDSARQYGTITGGPVVNVDRCVEILRRARLKGIEPVPAAC